MCRGRVGDARRPGGRPVRALAAGNSLDPEQRFRTPAGHRPGRSRLRGRRRGARPHPWACAVRDARGDARDGLGCEGHRGGRGAAVTPGARHLRCPRATSPGRRLRRPRDTGPGHRPRCPRDTGPGRRRGDGPGRVRGPWPGHRPGRGRGGRPVRRVDGGSGQGPHARAAAERGGEDGTDERGDEEGRPDRAGARRRSRFRAPHTHASDATTPAREQGVHATRRAAASPRTGLRQAPHRPGITSEANTQRGI